MAMVKLIRWMRDKRAASLTMNSKSNRKRAKQYSLFVERLEDRRLFAVSILNNNGNGLSGLSFNQSGGYVPPDTTGAAGPMAYVETVNQALALYPSKGTAAGVITDSLSHFLFSTGGLSRADSGSGLSDPIVTYDEKIGRFIVGDQDVNFSTHVSAFDLAVSKNDHPTTLSTGDWTFYKITTTQANEDADYPGNFGYNADALVFTLNMFPVGRTTGDYHTQVVSVNGADLQNAVASASLHVYANNVADFSLRPTTMHDSVASDPMWLVTDHGDGLSIDVYKMTNVLSTAATFGKTNLPVTSYSQAVAPLNPNGTAITTNIDSRIMKAAEANNTIVATHTVAASSTQDVAQWYAIDVSSGTPKLAQQGRVSAGNNTYVTYPGIDINASGDIGMSFIRSGNDTTTDYMSMWVAGRVSSDATGTMETPVKVPNASGLANYTDFASTHRAGDLSGINVDPVDGSFWAANEFANTDANANWGTGIANFRPSVPVNPADLVVTNSGPSSVTAGTTATYTITVQNDGPTTASNFVLKDTLPTGSTFVSIAQTAGPDTFGSPTVSGGTVTLSVPSIAILLSGTTPDTFTLVVSTPTTLTAGSAFNNTASVSSDNTTTDPNTANNTATVTGSIVGAPADLAVANVSGVSTANEGDKIVYTITVNNPSGGNPATGVVLKDTLDANLNYVSATASQGTISRSGSVVTYTIGTIAAGATVTLTVTAQSTEEGTLNNSAAVTATSADPTLSNNSATASTTVIEPPITVTNSTLKVTKAIQTYTVATFTHASGIEPTSAFTASINWGDGTVASAGTITLSGTTYTVKGTHKYTTTGTKTVTTTVAEVGLGTELLLLKAGDEVPDLPERLCYKGNPEPRSFNKESNEFVELVHAYLVPKSSNPSAPSVTINDLNTSLTKLLKRGATDRRSVQFAGLLASLRHQSPFTSKATDVLSTIDEVFANW